MLSKIHLSIKTKNSLSKDILMLTIGVKTQFLFNWCQATIGLKGVFDWGGARFHKFHGSSNVSLWRWSKYGYVSSNKFFMSFSLKSKSFIKSSVLTHNSPPYRLRGSSTMFHLSEKIKPGHIFSQKFPNYLNQLRSKISKDLIFFIGGENVT